MKAITRNFWLKIFSLLISFILWVYVTSVTYTVPHLQTFRVDTSSLDQTRFEIMGNKTPNVSVSVTGPPQALQALAGLNKDQFVAPVDLSNPRTGVAQYPVDFRNAPGRALGVEYGRANVTLDIEPLVDVPRTVKVLKEGVPPGYTVTETNVVPETVDLIGPQTAVAEVASCVVHVDLTGFKAGQVFSSVPVEIYDRKGRAIQSVDAVPSTVKVVPIVLPSSNIKTVPIDLNWTGSLSEYSLAASPRTSPQQITLHGPSDILDKITQVQTEPINLSRVRGDTTVRVKLQKLPFGVTADPKSLSVSFRVVRKEVAPDVEPLAPPPQTAPTTNQPVPH